MAPKCPRILAVECTARRETRSRAPIQAFSMNEGKHKIAGGHPLATAKRIAEGHLAEKPAFHQALFMPDQDLSQYLSFLLASANRCMRIGLSNSIGDEEFTEEHWRILHVLSDEEGRSMGELAELVLLNGPALTKNIDKLVSRGVVQRAADEYDNRRVLVFISDFGLDVVARLKNESMHII